MNLASSTLVAEGKCPAEALGIVISYSVRVKLNCGTLAGEVTTDVPFKLLHPAPGLLYSSSKALCLVNLLSLLQYIYIYILFSPD